jgi:hypothetical protein
MVALRPRLRRECKGHSRRFILHVVIEITVNYDRSME